MLDRYQRRAVSIVDYAERTDHYTPMLQAHFDVVLAAVDKCDRREFRSYCRLARTVDSPDLRQVLSDRLGDPDCGVRRRARWVLNALERSG